MAGPITWRSIFSQQPDTAARLMESAQRSFNGGFAVLDNVLKQRQQTESDNWGIVKENNTDAVLDKLASFRTPEELAAAQASGELDQFRQQFGRQIDADAVRNAEGAALDTLYDRIGKQRTFNDSTAELEQRPLINQFMAKYSQGDHTGATQLLQDNPGLLKTPELAKLAGDLRGTLFKEGIDRGQLDVSRGQLGVSQRRQSLSEQQYADTAEWGDVVRGRQQDTWGREDAVRNTAAQQALAFEQESQAYAQGMAEQAKKVGIPLNERGMPMLDQAGPIQLAALKAGAQQAGLRPPSSQTEGSRKLYSQVLQAGGSLQDAQTAASNFEVATSSNFDLAPEDQKNLDMVTTQIDTETQTRLASLNRDWQQLTAKNSFAREVADPLVTAEEVEQQVERVDTLVLDGTNRGQLRNAVDDALQNGIEYNGERIKATPALIKRALSFAKDSWTDPRADFNEALTDILDKGGYKQYAEALGAWEEHQAATTKVQTDSVRKIAAAKGQLSREVGTTSYNSRFATDDIGRRLKQNGSPQGSSNTPVLNSTIRDLMRNSRSQ